jgi:DNA-directed RNA polymerase subunit RPC12/RpoP
MIKKELGAAGWLLKEVDWSAENGIQLRSAPEDLRALIDLKRSQGHDAANDVRTLLEAILKEVCYALEVKVAFRYNDRNEERMVGEVLSELRNTLNRKAPGVKDAPILVHLETSNLLGTKGSHDRPKEVSKGDIDVALEDVRRFEALFRCAKCGSMVSRANFIQAEKKVSCRCGETKLDWKD